MTEITNNKDSGEEALRSSSPYTPYYNDVGSSSTSLTSSTSYLAMTDVSENLIMDVKAAGIVNALKAELSRLPFPALPQRPTKNIQPPFNIKPASGNNKKLTATTANHKQLALGDDFGEDYVVYGETDFNFHNAIHLPCRRALEAALKPVELRDLTQNQTYSLHNQTSPSSANGVSGRRRAMGLFATEAIAPGQLITEYRGRLRHIDDLVHLLSSPPPHPRSPQFTSGNAVFMPQSYVLFPHAPRQDVWWNANVFDLTDLVVDARKYGSIARYCRRSCRPNVIAKPVLIDTHEHPPKAPNNQDNFDANMNSLSDSTLHWVLTASRSIEGGDELCLPLDYGDPYNDGFFFYDCACGLWEELCLSPHRSQPPPTALTHDSSHDNHAVKSSVDHENVMNNKKPKKPKPIASSTGNNNAGLMTSSAEDTRKLSREERKLQRYIEFFDKMDSIDQKKAARKDHSNAKKQVNNTLNASVSMSNSSMAAALGEEGSNFLVTSSSKSELLANFNAETAAGPEKKKRVKKTEDFKEGVKSRPSSPIIEVVIKSSSSSSSVSASTTTSSYVSSTHSSPPKPSSPTKYQQQVHTFSSLTGGNVGGIISPIPKKAFLAAAAAGAVPRPSSSHSPANVINAVAPVLTSPHVLSDPVTVDVVGTPAPPPVHSQDPCHQNGNNTSNPNTSSLLSSSGGKKRVSLSDYMERKRRESQAAAAASSTSSSNTNNGSSQHEIAAPVPIAGRPLFEEQGEGEDHPEPSTNTIGPQGKDCPKP